VALADSCRLPLEAVAKEQSLEANWQQLPQRRSPRQVRQRLLKAILQSRPRLLPSPQLLLPFPRRPPQRLLLQQPLL
jgi:hypothetical protein